MLTYIARQLLANDEPFSADGEEELTEFQFTLYLTISVFLVLMAGLMSGLTLGLMSLDTVELEVLKRSGTPDEKKCAAVIMPVIRNQHFLLVTLLLCNAASTEALPLFIDRLADPFTAVVVSVTSVLVFGEIIPQAICSRYGLKVGAYSAWFVRALMFLCSPLAWPIGKLLDFLLGSEHSALFRRAQLKALVDVHSSSAGFGGTLTEQEIAVIRGALDLTSKTADKSMTPLDKVFMLSTEDRLDERTMQAILLSGHSRIPVYQDGNRKDIVGVILSKELVLIDPSDHLTVSQLKIRHMPRLSADTPMYDMLKMFETGKSHMALLTRPPLRPPASGNSQDASKHVSKGNMDQTSIKRLGSTGTATFHTASFRGSHYGKDDDLYGSGNHHFSTTGGGSAHGPGGHHHHGGGPGFVEGGEGEPIGIITIEDVIEELLQEEIIDETDLFVDNLQATRVNAAEVTGTLPPRVQRMLNAGLFTPRVGRLGAPQKFMMPPGIADDVSAHRHMDSALVAADGSLYGDAAGADRMHHMHHHLADQSSIQLLPVLREEDSVQLHSSLTVHDHSNQGGNHAANGASADGAAGGGGAGGMRMPAWLGGGRGANSGGAPGEVAGEVGMPLLPKPSRSDSR